MKVIKVNQQEGKRNIIVQDVGLEWSEILDEMGYEYYGEVGTEYGTAEKWQKKPERDTFDKCIDGLSRISNYKVVHGKETNAIYENKERLFTYGNSQEEKEKAFYFLLGMIQRKTVS